MTILQFRERIKLARSRAVDMGPDLAEQMGVSVLSLVKNRSIEEGLLEDGKPGNYAQYSTNKYPTSFLKGKELNAGGRTYVQSNRLGNWAGLRKAQGMKADKVNLAYTGRMWAGLQVVRTSQISPGRYEVVLGAVQAETRKKLAANVARYGRFFRPLDDERHLMAQVQADRLMNALRTTLSNG